MKTNKKATITSSMNKTAWMIRRKAAAKFGCRIMEVSWKECLRMARFFEPAILKAILAVFQAYRLKELEISPWMAPLGCAIRFYINLKARRATSLGYLTFADDGSLILQNSGFTHEQNKEILTQINNQLILKHF